MLGIITAINALTAKLNEVKGSLDYILGQLTLIAIANGQIATNTTPAEDTTPDEGEPQG